MASKEDGKAAAAPVSYSGDSIQRKLFWIGLILLLIGLVPTSIGIIKNYFFPGKSTDSEMVTCGGVPPELSRSSPIVKVNISQGCYSVVMIAPSANSRVDIIPKMSADVCFRKNNHCVAWAHKRGNELVEVTRSEIPKKNEPEYTAVLIKGDPGEAVIRLSR